MRSSLRLVGLAALLGAASLACLLTTATDASADPAVLAVFSPLASGTSGTPATLEALTRLEPGAIATVSAPFGPSPAPRIVLFPSMKVTRPSDIPAPKPTKGLALLFDW